MERARLLARRLGRLIHSWRAELGLTQAQMGKSCGMSAKHYGELERGDVGVTLGALDGLAQGFECSIAELIAQAENPHKGSARPTLDLRTWQDIRKVMRLISEYAARMMVHAESERPRYRSRR